MKHILMMSFGKDSMAMAYLLKWLGVPIDKFLYVKIMFDNNISAELPKHEKWINEYAIKKLVDDFGVPVCTLTSQYTYKDLFYKEITRGDRKGQNRGFPLLFGSWCHRDLKIKPVTEYLKTLKEPYQQFVGIASDEVHRIDFQLKQGNLMPLVDFNITEKKAFEIAQKNNVLSPAYEDFYRLGCWFCHKQSNKALSKVLNLYPELYNKIENLDNDSYIKFKQKITLREFRTQLIRVIE